MAISFVAAGAVATGANPTVAVPAGIQANDLLLITIAAGANAPTTPSGWTLATNVTTTPRIYVYYKLASSSESSVALTAASTANAACMLAYRGASGIDVSANSTTVTSTTIATTSVTTTQANDYVVSVYAMTTGAANWTAPASTTSRVNSSGTASLDGLLVVDELQAAAGATTARTATSSVSKLLSAVVVTLYPTTDKYWVGGTGTWNTTGKTVWSTSSGGASGAFPPNAQENVFFDQAATYTVTCTGAIRSKNLTVSAGTVTFSNGTSPTLQISGSLTLSVAITHNANAWGNTVVFNSTGSETINIGSNTLNISTCQFNGSTYTLGSNFALANAQDLQILSGTLNTSASNYSITIAGASTITVNGGTFTANASTLSVGSLVLTSGTVNLNSSTVNLSQSNPVQYTAGTFNSGTSTINLTYSNSALAFTINGNGLTYYDVNLTGTDYTPTLTGNNTFHNLTFGGNAAVSNTYTISGSNTFNDVSFTGLNPTVVFSLSNTFNNLSFPGRTSTAGVNTLTFGATQTISGTLTVSAGTNAIYRTNIASDVVGTARTLTCNAVSLTDVDFQDITISGTAAPASGTRLGDLTNNTGITFTSKTVYWNLAAGGNWQATAWATSSGGTVDVNNFPLAQDTAIISNTGLNTGVTITTNATYAISSIDASTRTNAVTFSNSTATYVYGNVTLGSGCGVSGWGLTFVGKNTKNIISAGRSWASPVINSVGGSVVLQDSFSGTALTVYLYNGTLDLNGKTLTTTSFQTQAGTKNITFNGGTLTITGVTTTAFNNAQPTGFTTTAGSGTGSISMTGSSAKTFVGGGSIYNCTLNNGGAGDLTISGANTFNNISGTYTTTATCNILFPASTTTTVNSFTATGTTGKLLGINSDTAGTQATIAYSGSGNITVPDYLSVKDVAFTPGPATDGTTPYVWYVGANSTNSSNNTGALFISGAGTPTKVYQITNLSTTSWTIPSDWNSNNNIVHLFGGGGGGGGGRYVSSTTRAAGGGGGGGGYNNQTNYQTNVGVAISVAIGSGGTAGTTSGGTGGTGGTTSWGITTATGGTGGSTTATPTSTGGTGGAGLYTGGTGGAGATSTATAFPGGGGGGGSAGPNGNAGAGGTGFASTTTTASAGGGGGGNGGGSAGGNGASNSGGAGGNNSLGTGGGAAGAGNGRVGILGGGGSGATSTGNTGGFGGNGIDILNSIGGAGGSGGPGYAASGKSATNLYGAGGSGGATNNSTTTYAGGTGGQGLIVIQYVPIAVSEQAKNFLQLLTMV
jgi:hypothetical protein